jgi:hypothetical protein
MRNQFAVLDQRGVITRVLFESSSTGLIYAWLKEQSVLDAPGYKVIDRFTSVVWEEGVFIREFEEEMEVASRGRKHISEDRIRTIVREEMSKLIDAVREKSCVPEYYDTAKMEDAVIAIVEHISDSKANEVVNKHEDCLHEGGYS